MATLAVQRDRAAAGEELVRVDVLGAACSVGIPTVDVVIPVYNEEAVLEHSSSP